MKEFRVVTRFGSYEHVVLQMDRYVEGKTIALRLLDLEEGPLARLTVNLPDEDIEENEGFLDVNNFPEAQDVVEQLGIGEYVDGWDAASGFCIYPLYRFDVEKIKEYVK